MEYLILALLYVLPALASVLFYLLQKKTCFGKKNYYFQQAVIGIGFGIISITVSEFELTTYASSIAVTTNVRNASPLISALLFGGPSGIIAGIMGGLYRFLSALSDAEKNTLLAASLTTILSGFAGAFLRTAIFDNKKPSWIFSMVSGMIIEVVHITLIFTVHFSDSVTALNIVKTCFFPIMLANTFSVLLSDIAYGIASNNKDSRNLKVKTKKQIIQIIQNRLLIVMVISFFLINTYNYIQQSEIAKYDTDFELINAVNDIEHNIREAFEEYTSDTDENISLEQLHEMFNDKIKRVANSRHIYTQGSVAIFDCKNELVSATSDTEYLFSYIQAQNFLSTQSFSNIEEKSRIYIIDDTDYYYYYDDINGYKVLAILPVSEAMEMRDLSLYIYSCSYVIIFSIMYVLIYLLIKHTVIRHIYEVTDTLSKITDGDLNQTVDVRSSQEFVSLSDDINATVDTLKQYITQANERIDNELRFARLIQEASLPKTFPAFPMRREFDLYASMTTAKKVGGDFYDFYFTDQNTLNLLIADVSGKGIPAAMFMMRAKSVLKMYTDQGLDIEQVFTSGNDTLCADNDAEMFVTAWQAQIDLQNGSLSFSNAGHTAPIIKHKNGSYEFYPQKINIILGEFEGIHYVRQTINLNPGDIIYLYTDGVTEATDAEDKMFGEERLLDALNKSESSDPKEICEMIYKTIEDFVKDADQYDDITMLAFRYNG